MENSLDYAGKVRIFFDWNIHNSDKDKVTLAGLNQEIKTFKTETAKVQEVKRKLDTDKEKLSKELMEFELRREEETRKILEEKRKLKRDKLLLDKANRQSWALNCYNRFFRA